MTWLEKALPEFSIHLSPQVLAALVVILLSLLIYQILYEPKDDWSLLPGPRIWPIIGNLEILQYGKAQKSHQFFYDCSKKYGNWVRLRVGSRYISSVFLTISKKDCVDQ